MVFLNFVPIQYIRPNITTADVLIKTIRKYANLVHFTSVYWSNLPVVFQPFNCLSISLLRHYFHSQYTLCIYLYFILFILIYRIHQIFLRIDSGEPVDSEQLLLLLMVTALFFLFFYWLLCVVSISFFCVLLGFCSMYFLQLAYVFWRKVALLGFLDSFKIFSFLSFFFIFFAAVSLLNFYLRINEEHKNGTTKYIMPERKSFRFFLLRFISTYISPKYVSFRVVFFLLVVSLFRNGNSMILHIVSHTHKYKHWFNGNAEFGINHDFSAYKNTYQSKHRRKEKMKPKDA